MFPKLSKAFFVPAGFLPLFFLCCAFADLRPIGIRTVPEGAWAVLPGEESPVIVRFDTEMEKSSAERALQIYSPAGLADGKMYWQGNDLYFAPFSPWKPGIRYALKLSGTVRAGDGRELLLSAEFPFYAVSRSSLPYLLSFSPSDGASVSSFGIGENAASPASGNYLMLELNFSLPMDRRSVVDALRFEIPGERTYEWLDDDRTLRVSSDEPLNPWTAYRWSISENALGREGAPLAGDFSGRFITDLNREFPKVARVVPLLPPGHFQAASSAQNGIWGSWTQAGPGAETDASFRPPGPGFKQGIGVEFTKPVEIESLRRAFGFVPALPGRIEMLSPVSAVFIPSKDFEPETVYSLRISEALKDTDGLKMGEDYTVSFGADIPFLKVLSVSFAQGEEKTFPETGGFFSVPVNAGGITRCIVHFSLLFDSENPGIREECAFKISLAPFFPGTLLPVSLRSAGWIYPDRLLLEWEGLSGGKPGEAHYYRLFIPGGPAGVSSGKGSYLKEDITLYLEAEDE